jgi:Rrf2 family transcriptional regulator, nitric oxide-sensitive transcriptional repressor
MQLTKFSDYSLRVLMFLARQADKHTTIHDIATAHAISENHLMKVVNQLANSGYVKTMRGKGGGVRLARAAERISIGAVVREVEPLTPAECFQPGYGGECNLFPRCALRGALHAAQAAFLNTLDAYTLRDVTGR